MTSRGLLAVLLMACSGSAGLAQAPPTADPGYRVGVVSESGDILTWLRPVGGGLVVDRVVPLGINAMDPDGPHHLIVAPDGGSYYVTLAHGVPRGSLWRFDARTDTVLGVAPVELFPTTIAITADGDWAVVANSDFHGVRPRVNPVSIIHTPSMTTVVELPACDMPHGVRAAGAEGRVWVSCMHSDEVLELDAWAFEIVRRVTVGGGHGAGDHAGHAAAPACAPTFVSASRDGRRIYLACNASGTLQERDAGTLALLREVPAGAGAYNVEPSPDGRFVLVTNKKDQSVSVFDAATLREVRRIRTTKSIVHGIAFAPDGRTAYISAESVGSDPGSVDVLDLDTMAVTGTIAIPAQPTGIAVLRR